MKVLHSSPVAGRLCCAAGEEVWVAKQSGGIAVFSALTGDHATDITLKGADGETPAQATHMIAVFEEMWVSTNEGRVHFYEIATHKWVDSVLIPGAERKVQVVSLSFNGHIAVIAAASGSVYIHHPLTHKRLGTLSTSLSPCTAVIQFYSFVVGGDAGGALYLWDPFTCECVIYHGESKSEVVALLHEPTTGTIWVSRANEHVDVYALHEGTLQLQHRVRGIGRVTGMVAVSGTVVATTFTKRIVQIDALTAKTTINVESAHDNFIHGCCKAMHQEVAQVWSIGNDGTLRVWNAVGLQVPAVPLPRLPPATQAALVSSMKANFELAQGDLRVEVQSERLHRLNMSEMLMKAREEAQELRLRLTGEEEKRLTIDAELAAERKHRKELEEHNAKLIKDATDMVSRFADTERECNSLRGEVTQLKVDLSKSRTEASTKQTERSDLEKQLSQERANRNVLEQRLRDAEGKLSSLQAEHRRVCDEMRSVTATHQTGRASQDILAKSTAAWCTELEHARKMNDLMRSAMASMEYTIRRREEEDRDLTSLLNAFRSRVADRVTDPNLSALLLATIARNAPRFDLQCDELTKAQLMNKNGPFLQFIQSLRAADPEAYEKLMQYLQNPSLSQALSADAQTLLDRFVTLASREGKVSGEDIASLKRAIPGFTDSAAIAQGAGVVGVVNASTPGASSAPHKGAILPIPVGVTTLQGSGAGVHGIHGGGAGPLGSAGGSLAVQNGLLGSVPLHELRGQAFTDDHYIREQQVMFEFILKTRHLLVESLAVLYKRIASARQVVEAFCLNTTAAGTSTVAVSLSHKNLQPFQGIFSDVVRELEGLAFDVLQRYLTTAEKQRLGVGHPLPQQLNEVLIGGTLYDCTHFHHPGGNILKYYLGSGDATETYQQFHLKLPRADKFLKRLPSRPAPPQLSLDVEEQRRLAKLSRDFKVLHDACIEEGLFNADRAHIVYRFSELILMHVIGTYMLFRLPTLWPIALVILGLAEGRCGWWMHEAGHYSVTGIPWVDIKIQEVLYGLGDGMSASWWRSQHNKHHATPQKHRHDVDLETLPLVAFNKTIAHRGRKNAAIRFWISLQVYLFGPVTCSLVALYWQLFLHIRHVVRRRRYTEGISILGHWIAIGVICYKLEVSFWRGLGGALFSQAISAASIFINFALNHTHLPMLPASQHAHFVEYAAIYTMNVTPSWFVTWFMGYLNFQVEHHLFPSMPQFRFVQLAPRVRQLFEENDLKYDSRSYMESLRATFNNLGEVATFIAGKD